MVKHVLAGGKAVADIYESITDWHHPGLGCSSLSGRVSVASSQQVVLLLFVLRVLIQFPILAGCRELPDLALPLLGFGAFDLAFALLTAIALSRSGIPWRNW